jgi:Uma2 family endonuclease
MPSSAASARYTWDDFVALEEDDLRELIDGELVEVEVPTARHEDIVMVLGQLLGNWADAGHGGRARGSLAEDETFRPESFDGLEIPLSKLWE